MYVHQYCNHMSTWVDSTCTTFALTVILSISLHEIKSSFTRNVVSVIGCKCAISSVSSDVIVIEINDTHSLMSALCAVLHRVPGHHPAEHIHLWMSLINPTHQLIPKVPDVSFCEMDVAVAHCQIANVVHPKFGPIVSAPKFSGEPLREINSILSQIHAVSPSISLCGICILCTQ